MQLVGDARNVTAAIHAFPVDYHLDFLSVRRLAHHYISSPKATPDLTAPLASQLRRVLLNWGAGKRKASDVRSVDALDTALRDPSVHRNLAILAGMAISRLGAAETHRRIDGQVGSWAALDDFDSRLIGVLNALADTLLVDNTNATYPLKALLLVTGLMPALDSQVRAGLTRAGFRGMSTTQFLLPRKADGASGKKITRLPFVLGQCWSEFSSVLIEGARQSKFPDLEEEPGRLLDVLLFVQAMPNRPVTLTHRSSSNVWYELE